MTSKFTMEPLTKLINNDCHVDSLAEQLHSFCGDFLIVPTAGQRLARGGTQVARLGGMDAIIVSQNIKRVTRNEQCIRRDPGENYFLIFQDHGQMLVCQKDSQTLIQAGDVILIDSALPSDFVFDGTGSQQISLHLARDEMHKRFGKSIQGGLSILKNDVLGIAMRAVLAKLLGQPSQDNLHLGEAFLGIFGAILTERFRNSAPTRMGTNEVLLTAALQQISTHYRESEFNAAFLAEKLNVPLRQLQRIFQKLGETPSRRILNTRLASSYDLIFSHVNSDCPFHVSRIVFDSGFNDLSFFYREFRKRYGVSPGQLAQAH